MKDKLLYIPVVSWILVLFYNRNKSPSEQIVNNLKVLCGNVAFMAVLLVAFAVIQAVCHK